MAVRSFESPDGISWTAWEVIPGQVSEFRSMYGSHLPTQMAGGWLCFDCGSEKRRLVPLPPDWADRTEAELWFLCRAAEPVRARSAASRRVCRRSIAPSAFLMVEDPSRGAPGRAAFVTCASAPSGAAGRARRRR